jgi:tetratricopeptide (TPR) repeat protein
MTAPTDVTDLAVADDLVADLVERWRSGERPLAEVYLDRRPDLWHHPEAALEIIAEELVLRAEFAEPTSRSELARRFPQWRAQVEVLVDCQRALGAALPVPRFPEVGHQLGDFHLLSELGRGAHGRAFLATQTALAARPVVLKLGPWGSVEHLSLARLQHTHIVPLYSVHEFPESGLHGLCLPYFGGATLADLLSDTDGRPLSGKDLLAAARRTEPANPTPARGLANAFLEVAAPAEVVCWVGACLAEALDYAHERGLLHLDLKPSNVLIAADGTPMLLDFHLALGPMRAGDPAPVWVGGTVGYMAPEQEAAMRAVTAGGVLPADLDGRADIYALGVLLKQLWDRLTSEGERRSVALADVLARCTAARAEDRYASAGDLAADLRRHLMSQPLRGVVNRSLSERWRKWRRRRPLALPLALAFAALIAAGIAVARYSDRKADRARSSLQVAEAHLDQRRYTEAAEASRSGEALLDGVPFNSDLRARLAATRLTADRGRAATELHVLCERVRPFYSAAILSAEQLHEAATRCREIWDQREAIAKQLTGQTDLEIDRQWRTDLLDLGILTGHLEARISEGGPAHERALATLAEAEELLGPSAVLDLERAQRIRALGGNAATDERPTISPASAWEHLAVGRAQLAAGDLRSAASSIDRCLAADPRSFWGNYHKGACALRQGEATEAVAAFSACVALAPNSPWCVYNRGLAYTQVGRLDAAIADFDRALALDSGLAIAFLGRAQVHHRAERLAQALADLRRAADAGLPAPVVEYQKALVSLSAQDRDTAIASLRACLALDPGHKDARDLLARISRN